MGAVFFIYSQTFFYAEWWIFQPLRLLTVDLEAEDGDGLVLQVVAVGQLLLDLATAGITSLRRDWELVNLLYSVNA